jgi:hypothetical protein
MSLAQKAGLPLKPGQPHLVISDDEIFNQTRCHLKHQTLNFHDAIPPICQEDNAYLLQQSSKA